MKYKIGFANGDVIFAEDRDCSWSDILPTRLKYVSIGDDTILLNMKHVAYIEKVGEESEAEEPDDRKHEDVCKGCVHFDPYNQKCSLMDVSVKYPEETRCGEWKGM